MSQDYETIEFAESADWRQWLEKHYGTDSGVWLRMYKKASGIASVNYAQALDEALCYGWIDGQRKSLDNVSFVQKFTPRRLASTWSKRNIEHVTRLQAAGLMTAAGQQEVERAKADGRWDQAYDAQKDMVVPDDFIAALERDPAALATFETLNKSSLFAIGFRLQTAKKPETRARRFNLLLQMLHDGRDPRA